MNESKVVQVVFPDGSERLCMRICDAKKIASSPNTFAQYANDGKIKTFKQGSARYIEVVDLEYWNTRQGRSLTAKELANEMVLVYRGEVRLACQCNPMMVMQSIMFAKDDDVDYFNEIRRRVMLSTRASELQAIKEAHKLRIYDEVDMAVYIKQQSTPRSNP